MIGLNEDANPSVDSGLKPTRVRELAQEIFSESGQLCSALSLEHRPEQAQMAHTVAVAMRDDAPLLFEAGTGVGKSLAYLIPGIIHAVDQGRFQQSFLYSRSQSISGGTSEVQLNIIATRLLGLPRGA